MSESNSTSSGSIGAVSLLGLIFITLKLIGIITWSWWWITAPFWVPAAIGIAVLLGVGLFALLAWAFEQREQ